MQVKRSIFVSAGNAPVQCSPVVLQRLFKKGLQLMTDTGGVGITTPLAAVAKSVGPVQVQHGLRYRV